MMDRAMRERVIETAEDLITVLEDQTEEMTEDESVVLISVALAEVVAGLHIHNILDAGTVTRRVNAILDGLKHTQVTLQ